MMAGEMRPVLKHSREMPSATTWFGRREDFDYDVFISYRRADGLKVAEWLSRRLRTYRPPRGFDRRVSPLRLYRDLERERVTPAIWEERIRPALLKSRFLVVVLTKTVTQPAADGTPNWVIREISGFLEAPQGSNLMLVQADEGVPLPAEIAARFPDPGWVDLRASHLRFWRRLGRRGILHDKLTALAVPALDVTDAEIPRFTQLAEREKRRVAWAVAGVSLALALVVSTLAGIAWVQAVATRRAAIVRTAESVVDSNATGASLLLTLLPPSNPPEGALSVAMRLARTPLSTVLRGHQLWVKSAAFSPDDTRVVTASGDGTARVWRADGVGQPVVFFDREITAALGSLGRALESVAFHPDGRSVVAVGGDGAARIWRLDGSGEPRVLRGHAGSIHRALFSPDGSRLLTSDGTTRIWGATDSESPIVLQGDGTAFSPDGIYVVAGDRAGGARIWRTDGTGVPYVLAPPADRRLATTSEFVDASFSPDGRSVVVASGVVARVWRFAESSEPLVLRGHDRHLSSATFSPDGTRVLTSSDDGTARLWAADREREPVVLRGHTGRVVTSVFSRDGTRVVTTSDDGTARVWRVDAPEDVVTLRGHDGNVMSAGFSRDGTRVITTGGDRTARIWDIGASAAHIIARYPPGSLRYASFDPEGKRIVSAHGDGTARIWPINGPGDSQEFRGHQGGVTTAAFSADGQQIVTASYDTTARVWRIDGRTEPVILRGHKDTVYSAAFSHDGRRVVTASDDRTAVIWPVDGGAAPMILRGHADHVRSALFSAHGTEVVTASDDGTARVWRLDRQSEPLVLGRHGTDVRGAAFSPDGQRVATGDANGVLRIWRLDRPADPALLLRGHGREINTVAFSPDGARVATASADGTARLWRIDEAREDATLPHDAAVLSARFSTDGRRIVTAAADGAVRTWLIDWGELLATLRSRTTACLTDEERRRYLGESPVAALRAFDQCEAGFGRLPVRIEHLPSSGELPIPQNPKL